MVVSDRRRSASPAEGSSPPPGPRPETADLAALARVTARDFPSLEDTVRAARRRRGFRWEAWLMSNVRIARSRPWITTALAGALAALALLVVPISYERIVGHDVTLTLAGDPGAERIAAIATGLKQALHAEHVSVTTTSAGGITTEMHASVPAHGRTATAAIARAFAAGLERNGIEARVAVAPRRQKVSGSLYAYAMDRVIEIDVDGKSAGQLEAELKQRLAAAGMPDAEVSVTKTEGEHPQLGMRIHAVRHPEGGTGSGSEMPELVLKKAGAPIGGPNATEVRMMRTKTAAGNGMSTVITRDGKTITASIPNADGMSDAAIAAELQRQLDAAGVPVRIVVVNGEISVEPVAK